MTGQSTIWFQRIRRVERAKVTFDFADLAVRCTWPDGFSIMVRSPTREFMDYSYIADKIQAARKRHLRLQALYGAMTAEQRAAADQRMIDKFIAAGKVTHCPTVYLEVSTGRDGNFVASDTSEHDRQIKRSASKAAKAGWRRRRQWKHGTHPE